MLIDETWSVIRGFSRQRLKQTELSHARGKLSQEKKMKKKSKEAWRRWAEMLRCTSRAESSPEWAMMHCTFRISACFFFFVAVVVFLFKAADRETKAVGSSCKVKGLIIRS